jgi:hypothetical protein
MKTLLNDELISAKKIGRFAKRNYETYKEHYKSRNMIPTLTLDDFLKNYSAS